MSHMLIHENYVFSGDFSLSLVRASISELTNFGWGLQVNGTTGIAVRFIRGAKMSSIQGVFDEVGAALQFPYYFGENWPAFDECICDLEWIERSALLLIVSNADRILENETDEDLGTFLKILTRASAEFAEPSSPGAPPRAAIPLKVFFHLNSEREEYFLNRISLLGYDLNYYAI